VTGRKASLTLQQKVEEGWWPGWAPLGYRNVNVGGGDRPMNVIEQDPAIAPLVRDLFERYATGIYSLFRLAETMNARGLRSRTGRLLTAGRVHHLLKNLFYTGVIPYKGKLHPGKHEPIVSPALFERVQTVLSAHSQGADYQRKHAFLLRGHVHCAICGGRYTAEAHPKKGKAYYHCTRKNPSLRHSNRGQNVAVADLEGQVEDLFRKIELPAAFIEKVVSRAGEILKATREGVDEERRLLLLRREKLAEQRDVLEKKLFSEVVSDDVYGRNHAKLESAIRALDGELSEVEEDRSEQIGVFEQLLYLAHDIHRAYLKAPYALKRQYLLIFWERIEAQDGLIVRAIPTKALQSLYTDSDLSPDIVITNSNWGGLSQMVLTELLRDGDYWRLMAERLLKLEEIELSVA
jgi:site-specific DNA recombinase